MGYELAWEIEQLPERQSDPLPFPVAYWYAPHAFAVLDHWEQVLYLSAPTATELDELVGKLDRSHPSESSLRTESALIEQINPDINFFTSETEYQRAIIRAQAYIQAGDIFQANLSLRFSTETKLDSWEIYQRLQKINPSPFASYWQTPWGAMISCSPERLVQLQQQQATTRPIAGTRKRGHSPVEDERLATELLTNQKEIAEHIMLVDLERNDLGRVCKWGTVKVDELLSIERYSHVMHLVSNVTGELDPKYDSIDLIRAMFPGGTITGCPKVRCMQIIRELEQSPRLAYTGSMGFLNHDGSLDLNILIRSFMLQGQQLQFWAGAGIVADSVAERELSETRAKAKGLLRALGRNTLEQK